MFKKITALLLSAAIITAGGVTASAENTGAEIISSHVRLEASAKTWDGKSELKAGASYVISKSVTVSGKVTIPAKTTLTVKKGGALDIASGGTLNIKGKLVVNTGAQMTVSGKLTLYKGKKLTVSGKLAFGTKANVALKGAFTVKKSGSVSGDPAKLSIADTAVIKISGKNTCAKLSDNGGSESDVPSDVKGDKAAVEKMFNDAYAAVLKGDFLTAIKTLYPGEAFKQLSTLITRSGMTIEQFCEMLGETLAEQLGSSGYTLSDISAFNANITEFKLIDDMLTASDKSNIKSMYGSFDKVASFSGTFTVTLKNGKSESLGLSGTAVHAGGVWGLYDTY